ncbi:PD-(D/E)XK nuclease-like domain-containing protein [Herbiconiux sp. YIM B11900]|uniref:PD-(D/E)XK nuclease-like domain-containing protein n=1 Tax=Herbiconiux sp. YIM B11900 TaxID=3404131 RepID=UPI003F833672
MTSALRTRDGVVHDLPEAEYHVGPELSSTGAKLLLRSPATFHYHQSHPRKAKPEFDLGTAVHSKVLGVGAQIEVIPTEYLAVNGATSTTAAKAFIADARSAGLIPVKQDIADNVNAMAEAVVAHKTARRLVEFGRAEVSVFATDPETGVRMRARFDYLADTAVDLKSIGTTADSENFSKQVATMGYDVQESHYLHTLGCATGDFSTGMRFIVVETEPPHLVQVHELSNEFAEIGAARAREARRRFKAGSETGIWGGYEPEPLPLQPPLWHIYGNQELLQ